MSASSQQQFVTAAVLSEGRSAVVWSRPFVDLLLTQFVFGLGFSTFHLLPKYLRTTLGASATEIGVVTGTGLVSAVVTAPVVALWLQRGARRGPAQIGLGLLAVCAFACSAISSVGLPLLLLRALQGLAYTLFSSAIVLRAVEIVPAARLGQAMGYVGLAALATNAISPMIAEPVADRYGWPAAFVLAGLWSLLALLPTARMPAMTGAAPAGTTPWRSLIRPELASALYAAFACGVIFSVMFTFTQPLALERGAHTVGAFFAGYAMAATGVRVLCGTVADRLGRCRVASGALLCGAGVVACGAGASPATLLALGVGLGLSHGMLYPALNALALERSSSAEQGLVATTFGAAFSLGAALSVLGFGAVADAHGYAPVFGSAAAIALTAAGVLFWIRSAERHRDAPGRC